MIGRTNAGGIGLNIKVIGGSIQPTTPMENTVWVNTSIAITGYILSPTKPEIGVEGQVWLQTSKSGVELNISKKNPILVYIVSCSLYTNGKWEDMQALIYASGAWSKIDMNSYPIKDGILAVEFQLTNNARLEQGDSYVKYFGTSAGYHTAWIDNVDLTDKTMVSAEGKFNTTGDSVGFYVAIWDKTQTNMLFRTAKAFASYYGKNSVKLDVTSYTGEYKVGITTVFTNVQQITKFEIT